MINIHTLNKHEYITLRPLKPMNRGPAKRMRKLSIFSELSAQ